MNLDCQHSDLLRILTGLSQGVPSKATKPVYNGVLLEAAGDSISATVTDGQVWMRSSVPAMPAEKGAVVVGFSRLLAAVRECYTETVSIATDENYMMLEAGDSEFRFFCLNLELWPEFPFKVTEGADMDAEDFAAALEQTLPALSNDPSRPVLKGLKWETGNGRMVATDSYKMVVKTAETLRTDSFGDCLIDIDIVQKALALAKAAPTITVSQENGSVSFATWHGFVGGPLTDGDYPRYESLIPDKADQIHKIEFSEAENISGKQRLLRALGQVMVMRDPESPVKVSLREAGDTKASFAVKSTSGEAEIEVGCGYEGPGITAAFNPAYMRSLVAVVPGETVVIKMKTEENPAILTSPDDEGFLSLLMPVRIKNKDSKNGS